MVKQGKWKGFSSKRGAFPLRRLFLTAEESPDLYGEEGSKGATSSASALPGARKSLLLLLVVGGLIFLYFYALQFSTPNLVGTDGYFHIKYSYLLRQLGFIKKLPWLQFTVHRDYYRDHRFLFHLLYVPFTFSDLRMGAKWASTIFPTLALLTFYLILVFNRVPYAPLWVFFLLGSGKFFAYRMLMPRVQCLALLFFLLAIYFLFRKKHFWLFLLSFFFVWLYDAFPLILLFAGIFVLVNYYKEKKWDWKPLFFSLGGILLGIILNPYFPRNITSYIFNFHRLFAAPLIKVGNEWEPYNSWMLFSDSLPIWILLGSIVTISLFSPRKYSSQTLYLFLLTLFFLLLLLRSRRYIEYWPAIATVFASFWIRDVLPPPARPKRYLWFPGVLSFLIIIFLPLNFVLTREAIREERPYDFWKGAATWLKDNTSPGTVVFNTDWDDFPQLFFYNSLNYYIVGLDPKYMYFYSPELYEKWRLISRGKWKNPHQVILKEFNSRYVVSDRKHLDFMGEAARDGHFVIQYIDENTVVYSIKEEMENEKIPEE